MKEELTLKLVQLQLQFKFLHWQTFGDAKHRAYGGIYDSLGEHIDKFVEAIKEDSSILETIQAEIIKAKNQGAKNDMHLEDEEQIVATLEQLENDNFADENQEE